MSARVSIIAALGKNTRAIGKDNDLIWRISEDLKNFKALTKGHPIIMGRKTFESIGRALPQRTNIVITRRNDFTAPDCTVVHTLDEALTIAKTIDTQEIFIIGGGEIYQQALPRTDRLYLTVIDDTDKETGDTFFPDYSDFKTTISRDDDLSDDGQRYSFVVLER